MSNSPSRISAARRNAEALLQPSKKRERSHRLQRDREHEELVQKSARLRELRLAKEAVEQTANPASAPAPRPKLKRWSPK